MSLLAEQFRALAAKSKDVNMIAEAKADVGYSTGFLNFDFINGYIATSYDATTGDNSDYFVTGLTDGSLNMIIGRSGCGKSTFCAQVAANIVRKFKTACIFEDSTEGCGMTWQRREQFSGWHNKELHDRYIVRNTGITIENIYSRINMLKNIKLENREAYEYDTGKLDNFGNPIRLLEPTVYIIDSLAMLMPGDMMEEDEMSGSMATTAGAKKVTQMIRGIIPMLKMANIIVLIVNHILDDVSLRPKKPSVAYLKQGETLPKGKTVLYACNNVIRLDDSTKLKEDEKFKIAGSIVSASLVKSRSARANTATPLLFSQDTGFDPILSLFLFLQEKGRINGSGVGMFLDDRNDMKFSMGTFKNKALTNPEFSKLFMDIAHDELSKIPRRPSEINNSSDRDAIDALIGGIM